MTRNDVINLLVQLHVIPSVDNDRRVIVQLGKYGDILNILPAVKVMSDRCGAPVNMMVAKEFVHVVRDLSYVTPIVFEGHFFIDFLAAVNQAEALFDDVLVSQITGKDFHYLPVEKNFNRESWRRIGMQEWFSSAPLVLDNRKFEEEECFSSRILASDRKNLLVNLSGTSSPISAGPTMMHWIREALPEVNVVDLSVIRANQITDLLGLYDRAIGLITCDTATLHLARGHSIPVIALTAEGWHGTEPVVNCAFQASYSQAWGFIGTIIDVARKWSKVSEPHPKILHLQQDYVSKNANTLKREIIARMSWDPIYTDGVKRVLFKPSNFPNATATGDKSDAPDIKAILDHFILGNPHDIVAFSNSDICALPQVTAEIRKSVNRYGCYFSHRIDVDDVKLPLPAAPAGEVYSGADLFAFSCEWWKNHRDEFPNLFMSFEGWDFVAKAIMLKSGFVRGLPSIVHQRHEETNWKYQNERPGQKHNRTVCRQWAKENGFSQYLFPPTSNFLFKEI